MNVAAIITAGEIEKQNQPATRNEQARLVRFISFGSSELANGTLPRSLVRRVSAATPNHRSMIDELRRASDRKIVPEKLAAYEDKLAQSAP